MSVTLLSTAAAAPRVLRPLARLLASIGIDTEQKAALQTECLVRHLPPGAALWRAGEPRTAACFVCHGLVLRRTAEGRVRRADGVAGAGGVLGIEPPRAARHGDTVEAITAVELALFDVRTLAACDGLAARIVTGPLSVACLQQWAWFAARADLPLPARVDSGLRALVATAGSDAPLLSEMHFDGADLADWLALPAPPVMQALAERQGEGGVQLTGAALTSIDARTMAPPPRLPLPRRVRGWQ